MIRTGLATVFTAIVFSIIFSISWCPQGTLALDCGHNASHNAFFGRKQAYDTLLYMNPLKVEYSWLRIVETDVQYPSPTDIKGLIHYIEVLDQNTDGNGACAYMTGGGIGERNVSFHIKSKRNYGIDFIIRIYGIADN
uniref:Secreted venom family 2 protein n=1 Tax=Pristhesancus plagipennis TaxID=1955184 RepID=A0A2K8JMK4_PRIPG|nr:secreted venom family 2 protein [Pristhesancus plagipennis]